MCVKHRIPYAGCCDNHDLFSQLNMNKLQTSSKKQLLSLNQMNQSEFVTNLVLLFKMNQSESFKKRKKSILVLALYLLACS